MAHQTRMRASKVARLRRLTSRLNGGTKLYCPCVQRYVSVHPVSRAKVQRPILLPAASVECEDLLGRRFESMNNLEGMAINNICLQNIHFLSFRLGDRRKEKRCPEVDMFRTVTKTIFSGLSNSWRTSSRPIPREPPMMAYEDMFPRRVPPPAERTRGLLPLGHASHLVVVVWN